MYISLPVGSHTEQESWATPLLTLWLNSFAAMLAMTNILACRWHRNGFPQMNTPLRPEFGRFLVLGYMLDDARLHARALRSDPTHAIV
jgi:hypothetical protein